MTASDHLQQQLFTPPATPTPQPGDLSHEDWMNRPDVSFHGTRMDPAQRPLEQEYLHTGTRKAAAETMKHRGERHTRMTVNDIEFVPRTDLDDMDEDERAWRDPPLGELHVLEDTEGYDLDELDEEGRRTLPLSGAGRVAGFRRMKDEDGVSTSDYGANMAHALAAMDSSDYGTVSSSIVDTLQNSVRAHGGSHLGDVHAIHEERAGTLRGGTSLSYKNDAEDLGSTSYVTRRSGLRSYAEDAVHSNRSEGAKSFWSDRIERGLEGPFAPQQVEVGQQGRFNTNPDAEKIYANPESLYNTVSQLPRYTPKD